ncbi:MAG TPA: hypothetical protein PKB02_10775, partial [Anaerohalosphaeraceae bacterium]|nr:hypothetical protein [Anaerohalosphaeraceae bacterium]
MGQQIYNPQQQPARRMKKSTLAVVLAVDVVIIAVVVFGAYRLWGYLKGRPAGFTQQDVQTVNAESLRIVSLAPNLTEILYAMGLD